MIIQLRSLRALPVALLLPTVAATSGCEILEEVLRAGVTGTVQIPEATNASTRRPMEPALKSLRDAVAEAARKNGDVAQGPPRAERRRPDQGAIRPPEKHPVEKFRPGEVIVRAHEPIRPRKAEISRALSAFLNDDFVVDVRLCGTETRCLADVRHVDGKPLDLDTTARITARLAQHPLLKYAERNLILAPAAVFPDDEFYSFQWHFAAIDVPDAWEITTGDPDVVAAVIDTGILVDHPDLQDRVVGRGADLIDDPGTANDGDGRDDDGDDAGDNAGGAGQHSYHGSHVAGTMGASTNNGVLVSGITWSGGLLPVRCLGDGGGSLADIADGIEWAVGNDVDGVARNTRPADVLNMSLGGVGASEAMNEAVADAVATGAIVLVAAGNDDSDASDYTPANAPDSITVAAVGNGAGATPEKSSYSNFGNRIDVAGPGGEQAVDNDGDGNGDGVLSTVGDFVSFYQGTSMATPHVAGVAMLMKSVDRGLTQEDARQILTSTADPIDCSAGCGAGQINAFAAVTEASGNTVGGVTGASVRVGRGTTTATIVFRNRGGSDVDVAFFIDGADAASISLDQESATIPAGGRATVTATITRNDAADDAGTATIVASSVDANSEARLDWTGDAVADVESVTVGAVQINLDGSFTVAQTTTTNKLAGYAYELGDLDSGEYLIVGLLDADNNGSFDDAADGTGFYVAPAADGSACTAVGCGHIQLLIGELYEGADFLVAPGFTGGES